MAGECQRACDGRVIRKRDKDPGKMLTPSSYLGLCLEQLASPLAYAEPFIR